MTRTVMPGSGPVSGGSVLPRRRRVAVACAAGPAPRAGSLTCARQDPSGSSADDGQVQAGLDPPQQVRAGAGGRVPQLVAVEAPVGQQQHARRAGCPAAAGPGPARRCPCRAPGRRPRPAAPGCRTPPARPAAAAGSRSRPGRAVPAGCPARSGRRRRRSAVSSRSRACRTRRRWPGCLRVDGGPVPGHRQQPARHATTAPGPATAPSTPAGTATPAAFPRAGAAPRSAPSTPAPASRPRPAPPPGPQ